MDRVAEYREIIKRIIREAASYDRSNKEMMAETVFDDEHGHYMLFLTGWEKYIRIHGSVIHIDIINDKIYVQHDGTDLEIVDQLLEAGIPESQIVLGFHHPGERKYTEFAVA